MKEKISRRDFIKLSGIAPLSLSARKIESSIRSIQTGSKQKNILIIVYDAFSGENVNLYGYGRNTLPNLKRLSERAIVYHNHFSTGNFTTPGTASLFTGTLPWTHRAFNQNGKVDKEFITKSIFSTFPDYYRMAFTHNPLVETLLNQLVADIERYIPTDELFFYYARPPVYKLFNKDKDIANVGWVRSLQQKKSGYTYTLFLSQLFGSYYKKILTQYRNTKLNDYLPKYPRGIPNIDDNYYIFEHATDYLLNILDSSPQPFLGYFHFYPPHLPYSTRIDFTDQFKNDGFNPVVKPEAFFTAKRTQEQLNDMRTRYDEYLLYVDSEFDRLIKYMDNNGMLDNTWVIMTSDHGEFFERGKAGHGSPSLYQPVIHVPLMIFEPGRTERLDIYTPTNSIDILPTLAKITGQIQPDWTEGEVLPPFGPVDENRIFYSMQLKFNEEYGPIELGSITLIRSPYKLIYFFGYRELPFPGGELIELYDLSNDPDELNNLYSTDPALAKELLDIIKKKLNEVNQPYQK